MSFVIKYLKMFFGFLDQIVYDLISKVYDLLMEIANINLFDNEIFSIFAERIYALLGLFMLFKVSFSLIKYIVNPDEFNDKSKGGKKIVMNILIVLVLIVTTPMAFRLMYDFQRELLEQDVVGKLILNAGITDEPLDKTTMGKTTAMTLFTAFYRPSDNECANAVYSGDESLARNACANILKPGAITVYTKNYRLADINGLLFEEVSESGEPLFHDKTINGKEYSAHYMFIVSTIVGGFVIFIFLNFCFDIAIRTVKFGFLQMISPIPIISYIDPNSAKNGMFSKWLKEVGKTYADLFIRLAAVYFAISLISLIMQNGIASNSFLAKTFIILGILLFAKRIPQLIGDLLGIKIDANFNLNPMNRIRETPIVGAMTTGAAGLVGGAYAGYKAGREVGTNGITSGIIGGVTGAHQMASKVGFAGAKPGAQAPRAFGESMNSVFKQMTNREMTNLNPVNMFTGRLVKDRLKAVKQARNNASARLSSAQVTQQAAFKQVQESAVALDKLSATDRDAFLEKVDYYTEQARIRDDNKSTDAERALAKANMQKVKDEINRTYTGNFADVAAHFNDRVAAQEATSTIAAINRDIDDLTKEKAQIERFGHIDSAATRDVDSILDRYSATPSDSPLTAPTGGGGTSGGVSPGGVILPTPAPPTRASRNASSNNQGTANNTSSGGNTSNNNPGGTSSNNSPGNNGSQGGNRP